MDKKKIKVRNRFDGAVVVTDQQNRKREWAMPNAIVELTEDEIRDIYHSPGGAYTLRENLVVLDKELVNDLGLQVEPEYFFSETTVKGLLANGTEEQLQEALEYGGDGVRNQIKFVAIETEITDLNKIKIINKALDIDLMSLQAIHQEMVEDGLIGNKENKGREPRKNVYSEEDALKEEKPKERVPFVGNEELDMTEGQVQEEPKKKHIPIHERK